MSGAVLVRAGKFKAHYNLSLADSLIAAYAYEARAILLHNDPEYEAVAEMTQEFLPRGA